MHELDQFGVLLVDDHPLFREGLTLALRQRVPGLDLIAVASAAEARSALDAAPERFDLVVIDYRLPGDNGLACAARLRKLHPGVACALMSGAEDPSLPGQARAAGLMGYFPKSLDVQGLLNGLLQLSRGQAFFAAAAPVAAPASAMGLTARQQEIVQLAGRGASNKEIAQVLGIAPHTVKNHLAQIFEKLGASNRTQAVALAQGVFPNESA